MAKIPPRPPQPPLRSALGEALAACRGALIATALFSGMSNILMLTGSFFMLEIYDRVLPSRSIPTLIVLLVLAGGLFAGLGILDMIRARILVRIGNAIDEAIGPRVFDAIVRLPLIAGNRGDGMQPLRDLDAVRTFVSGVGPIAFFDLPWIPVYLGICFIFHVLLGLTALIGALVLVMLTLLTEIFMRHPSKGVAEFSRSRTTLVEASRRNSEALTAMGMAGRLSKKWLAANQSYVTYHREASDVGGGLGSISKVLRMMLQSGLLAVGAYLVINQQATGGIIIAGSIIGGRALAPVDLVISQWKQFMAARLGWQRLNRLLSMLPQQAEPMQLQVPAQSLSVEGVAAGAPGEQKVIVAEVTFKVEAGSGLGIIGPTASGKSTLARLIVGVWRPVRGNIRLDGAALDQWSPEILGQHIGYLPQDVELFAGTVAENISRFEEGADPETIIAAATAAGVHEMIVGLPEGYDTQVGEQGAAMSAGQAQRLALARALYREPFLVVLDEPNANLDSEGDEALTQAIIGVRRRNGIVIVVAHRPSAITGVDLILVMNKGRMHHFGPKDEVLAKATPQRPAAIPRPLQVVPEAGRSS